MINNVADRMSLLHGESAFAIMAKANSLEAEGKSIIHLEIGQPDFKTPQNIIDAACNALNSGKTGYTPTPGIPQLRETIAEHCWRHKNVKVDPSEVVVVPGGKPIMFYTMLTLVNPGDEVIIPVPSFVCYGPLTTIAGGVPVMLETKAEDDFKLTAESLKAAITDKTKVLILPFPNNPTGAIMTAEELEEIAKIIRGTNIAVISDEIYAELTFTGKRHVSIASLPGMRERTVVVNGFSKAYAMTGWRMGYTAAPKEITEQMLKIHQYGIMCAPTTSQYAAIEALRNGDEDIEYMAAEYNRRRRFIVDGLRKIGIPCFEPHGAFYVFPNIGAFGLSSEEFCERLLYEEGVAIVPGTAFGECGEGFARISYAYSVKHISTALEKMEKFVNKLR